MTHEPTETAPPEEVFRRATALHEQGSLDQAEQLYRAILHGNPNDLGSLYNLGILCFQRG